MNLIHDRDRGTGFLLQVGKTDQSYVDLDDPEWLEFDYIQRMADALEAFEPSRRSVRVIHIGGAGMTLARYVAATRPRSPQIVLEPYEVLTAYVREHLPLPPRSGIKVRAVDGRSGMAALRADYANVVILDAFDGARVPAELATAEFFAQVSSVLTSGGLFMLNLTDRAPFEYLRRILSGLKREFPHILLSAEPATFKGRRFGNVLVCASLIELPSQDLAAKASRSAFPYRVIAGESVARTFSVAPAFTDEDSAMSPEPPGGKTFFS
ncbi:MAG: fused MFS/spermidine synthase [Aeromicrobium sp.]